MPAEQQTVPCLACGGAEFSVLLTPEQLAEEAEWLRRFHSQRQKEKDSLKDKAEFTQEEAVYVLRCVACGTLVRNPQPTPQALERRYRNDRYGRCTLEELLANEREFFRGKAAAYDLPAGARVLEIGSFVGAFLLAARERQWQAVGVDIGAETSSFCREMGLKVASDLDQVSGPFDAVFIWNTFDQINEPRSLLRQVSTLLREGGTLVLRVPNGEFRTFCLQERHREMLAYNNFLTFPYLVGYTRAAVTKLLGQCGFQVQRVFGDVILPLSNERTEEWAVLEELRIKRLVLRVSRMADRFIYPWMDVDARSGKQS